VLLRDEARVSVIQPQLLSEQATRVLIERQLGVEAEDAFCAACHRATGGNPFFVSELAALLRADGIAPTAAAALQIASLAPDGIVRSVMVRLGRMSHEAVALARCVAVLGAKAEVRHAGALAGLGPAAAAVAADALAAAGLIASGRPLRFVHPVVRSALYCELAAGERAQLHGRAARLLADEHGELDAIAAHLLASDPAGEHWRIDVLLKGADRALARGAPSIAAACLRRALAEPPPRGERGLVLWRLGGVEARLGDPAAAEHARSAIELATEPRRRAELAFELSIGYLVAGRFEEAIGTLERALEQIDERDEELRWRLEAQLISLARLDGRVDLARRHLERIPRDLRGVTPGERVILAELAHAALIAGEHVETVADLVRRALGADRLVTEHSLGAWPVVNAIMVLAHTEQHELALRACDGLIARSQRKGSPIVFAVLSSIRARLHYMGGAIPDAIGDAKAAIGAASEFGQLRLLPDPCATLIDALLEASDIEGAQRALLSAGVGDEIPKSSQFVTLIRRRGRLRLAQGQTEAGIGDLLAACQLLADLGLTSPMTTHLRATTAVALAGEGRRAEAQLLLGDELVAARRFGAHGTLGIALRAAGVIEGGETGVAYLREAVVHLERSTARLEHARALADLGAALRRAGQRREAQQALRQALDLADRCGGKAVGEQGRAELRIMGARPRRARTAGVGALTPSERRVAQLAAQGLSSPHIAQQLFVTVNTVETHLRHAYMKLDIHSREQLPQALAAG
jgi:DNA-binding CsgD family transcriptional regulator/Flp pilus assembly protein TadD